MINRKMIYMLMKCGLTVSKETKKGPERPERFKPKAERPKEYWGQVYHVHDKFRLVGSIWS